MAIIVREIQSDATGGVIGLVEHCGHLLVAMIAGDPGRLRLALGCSLTVELDFAKVLSSRLLAEDLPHEHGLFPLASGEVRVIGAVHNKLDVEGSASLVDVYLQAGPEFLTFEASSLTCSPPLGSGLEVVVSGLRFFPTWT